MTDNLSLDEAVEKLDGDVNDLFDAEEDDEQQEAAESDESDEESDDEEEAEEADDGDEDPVVAWETKSGEKVEVTLSELKNGFMRTRDYTQKTQEASELRKKSEAAESAYREKAQAYESALTEWAINGPKEPDWVALARDPQRYVQARAQWDQYQSRAAMAKTKLAELRQEAQADRTRRAEEMLLADFPQWKNPDAARKDGEKLRQAAETFGFTGEELGEYLVQEPRIAKVLMAAARFEAMQKNPASIKKRVSEPGKTLRPGAKVTSKQSATRKQKEATQRFKQAPTMSNALDALGDIDLF